MLRWDLTLTTKLAYALSTVIVLFLSSAFISLANAAIDDDDGPLYMDSGVGMEGVDGEDQFNAIGNVNRIRHNQEIHQRNQDSYIERWQVRKHEYRLLEEYADWLRDHESPGSGNFGPQGFGYGDDGLPQMMMPIATFFDIIQSIF